MPDTAVNTLKPDIIHSLDLTAHQPVEILISIDGTLRIQTENKEVEVPTEIEINRPVLVTIDSDQLITATVGEDSSCIILPEGCSLSLPLPQGTLHIQREINRVLITYKEA